MNRNTDTCCSLPIFGTAQASGHDYKVKPFNQVELVARLKRFNSHP